MSELKGQGWLALPFIIVLVDGNIVYYLWGYLMSFSRFEARVLFQIGYGYLKKLGGVKCSDSRYHQF